MSLLMTTGCIGLMDFMGGQLILGMALPQKSLMYAICDRAAWSWE